MFAQELQELTQLIIQDPMDKRLTYLGVSMMVKTDEELDKELDQLTFEG